MRRLRRIAVLTLALPAKLASQQRSSAAILPPDSIVTVYFGQESGFLAPARLVITDSILYSMVWDRLSGGAPLPPIDFARYQLVLAAYGPIESLTTQIVIDTIEARGVVRVWTFNVGAGCTTPSAIGHPVHLVRIPRSVRIFRFDDLTRASRSCALPIMHFGQLRWLQKVEPHP